MAKFSYFEDDRGNEVHINASLVRVVRSAGEKLVMVEFDDEHTVGITLPASLVVRDLEKAVGGVHSLGIGSPSLTSWGFSLTPAEYRSE